MHIAFWSPAWPLEKFQNGIITYVHSMKCELERQGHRVSVFTSNLDPSRHDPNVYLVAGKRRPLWHRAARRLFLRTGAGERDVFNFSNMISEEILRVHRQDPIDILEMEESFGWFADVGRRTSLPVLVKLHGPAFLSLVEDELSTSLGRARIDREGCALKLAPAIISPSASTLAHTIKEYNLAPKLRQHIVNPLMMDGTIPLWRLTDCDSRAILFVGRFDLRKGADVVLKAFLLLLTDRSDLKLIFVGPDSGLPSTDRKLIQFESYRNLLFPQALRSRIDFRGRMSNDDVAKVRTQAMVTVIASRWENQGYTLLEAMLQGCPVVSTNAGGCPESVSDGVTGRLAKSEDPHDFAAQICSMLDDPTGAEAIGRAARQYVIEQHAPARVVGQSLEMYERVIIDQKRDMHRS